MLSMSTNVQKKSMSFSLRVTGARQCPSERLKAMSDTVTVMGGRRMAYHQARSLDII